nr:zinc finger and BTB domain-containing protein 10-like [Paramormyrops kingsleyae]
MVESKSCQTHATIKLTTVLLSRSIIKMQKRKRQEKIDTFFKRNPVRTLLEALVSEAAQEGSQDVARSEEDRDEEGVKGRQEADRQEADRREADRQEKQSEGEVREDKDADEMVERGAENTDVDVTRHQFSKPNQPDPKLISKQSLPKYSLSFQTQWYQKFPWLHVSPDVEGVLCFYCSKAFDSGTSSLAKNADSAFISSGFKNWKKALERFTVHERSDSHKTAMTTHIYENRSVQVQLSSVSVKQQEEV